MGYSNLKLQIVSSIFKISVLLLVIIFASIYGNIFASSNYNMGMPDSSGYWEFKNSNSKAQKVKVGFYTQNIYELDLRSNTYYMDFYIWFNWKGKIDPTENLEFMNGVEDWGLTKESAYESPLMLEDSSYYQLIRVEGRFRENFQFEKYPLDEQNLSVTLENSVHTINELIYIADKENSGFANDISIPGWQFKKFELSNLFHIYSTNFGFKKDGVNASKYSAVKFELSVSRPVNYFIWKLLFPLLIVLLSSWGALLLNPSFIDSRILLPITALLTVVFLQQSYTDALPAVNYLVLIDKLYVLAYILIIGAIMETIYTAGIIKSGEENAIEKVKRIDKVFLIGKAVFLIVGIIGLLLL